MHIPDGFLDLKTASAGWVVSAAGVGLALRGVQRTLPARRAPLLGLAAAFIFVAQMLNFPVLAGTSGHLIGGVLASTLLGLEAAIVVMTSVLAMQCLLFADGGLLALGANIFNMAILAPAAGYAIYRVVGRALPGARGRLTAAGFAAWCSVVAAAVACAGELAVSGTVPWRLAFPAMASVHMLIGFGEALITMLVVAAIARTRPELLREAEGANGAGGGAAGLGKALGYGLVVSAGLALFVAPFASPWPDGLERVASRLGFEHRAAPAPALSAPLAGYHVPGFGSPSAATAVAALAGILAAFLVSFAVARSLAKPSVTDAPSPGVRGW